MKSQTSSFIITDVCRTTCKLKGRRWRKKEGSDKEGNYTSGRLLSPTVNAFKREIMSLAERQELGNGFVLFPFLPG